MLSGRRGGVIEKGSFSPVERQGGPCQPSFLPKPRVTRFGAVQSHARGAGCAPIQCVASDPVVDVGQQGDVVREVMHHQVPGGREECLGKVRCGGAPVDFGEVDLDQHARPCGLGLIRSSNLPEEHHCLASGAHEDVACLARLSECEMRACHQIRGVNAGPGFGMSHAHVQERSQRLLKRAPLDQGCCGGDGSVRSCAAFACVRRERR